MTFRYYDCDGHQLTPEQLRELNISTPVMEHVFASVLKRVQGENDLLRSSSKRPEPVEGQSVL